MQGGKGAQTSWLARINVPGACAYPFVRECADWGGGGGEVLDIHTNEHAAMPTARPGSYNILLYNISDVCRIASKHANPTLQNTLP